TTPDLPSFPTRRSSDLGTVIAFQDYSVLGDSRFVGAQNFASVLFSGEFWHSVRISLIYAGLFLIFGFWVPIALAFLLQEVPRGRSEEHTSELQSRGHLV